MAAPSLSPALWGGETPPQRAGYTPPLDLSTRFPQLKGSTHPPPQTHELALSLATRIQAFLHPDGVAVRPTAALLARLSELEAGVRRLEEREVAHDVAWSEAKEQISRHLKRVVEVERRAGGTNERGVSPITQQLLDLKLRKQG